MIRKCSSCKSKDIDKGRGFDGRRCYRCNNCGQTWSEGMQGRKKKYKQSVGMQFKDTGVVK